MFFELFIFAAQCQTLISWDVSGTGNPAVSNLGATTIATNLSSNTGLDELSRTGLTAASANDSFNSSGWNTTSTFDQSTDYISFSLTAAPGYEATLTGLSCKMSATSTASNGAQWIYSIAGAAFVQQGVISTRWFNCIVPA